MVALLIWKALLLLAGIEQVFSVLSHVEVSTDAKRSHLPLRRPKQFMSSRLCRQNLVRARFECGTLTVSQCTLRNNSAGGGGAVANPCTGTVAINNGTLNDNSALFSGGAIDNSSGISNVHGTVNVSRCGIRCNLATRSGGGVRNTGIFNLTDTTAADNRVAGTDNNAAFGAGIYSNATLALTRLHHFG
jgi:hypothetical protein